MQRDDDDVAVPCAAKSLKAAEAAHQMDPASTCRPANVGVKIGTYNGSTCLETFLAGVWNFAAYFNWTERGELFHLRASLRGQAGQLLWDMSKKLTLAELIRLLHQDVSTVNQAEQFHATGNRVRS